MCHSFVERLIRAETLSLKEEIKIASLNYLGVAGMTVQKAAFPWRLLRVTSQSLIVFEICDNLHWAKMFCLLPLI